MQRRARDAVGVRVYGDGYGGREFGTVIDLI